LRLGGGVEGGDRAGLPDGIVVAEQRLRLAADGCRQVLGLELVGMGELSPPRSAITKPASKWARTPSPNRIAPTNAMSTPSPPSCCSPVTETGSPASSRGAPTQ